MFINFTDLAYVDYSLAEPVFTRDFLDFNVRGEFLNLKHPVHSKLQPSDFHTVSSSRKMVYIWLTDYSLNTAADVFHTANLLQVFGSFNFI